jgi:tetratricopeptide (TPR) repeat protein
LDPDVIKEAWANLGELYGLALRMTGKRAQAVDYLRDVLERSEGQADRSLKASIYLDIAHAEESLENVDGAVAAAEEAKRLTDEKSVEYLSAVTIIDGKTPDKETAVRRLKQLRQEAFSRKFFTLADNISLDLARRSTNDEERIKLLDSVLKNPSAGIYNTARAMSAKARIVNKGSSSEGLDPKDRSLLASAYIYSRSQRYGNLFDTCHAAMWELLEDVRDIPALLRLFRHSSFLWRVRGQDKKEASYAERLSSLKPPEENRESKKGLVLEIRYFWKRLGTMLEVLKTSKKDAAN